MSFWDDHKTIRDNSGKVIGHEDKNYSGGVNVTDAGGKRRGWTSDISTFDRDGKRIGTDSPGRLFEE